MGISLSTGLLIFISLVVITFVIYKLKSKTGSPLNWNPSEIARVYNWSLKKAQESCSAPEDADDVANKFTTYAYTFWNIGDFNCINTKFPVECPSKIISKLNDYLTHFKCT